MCIVHKIWYKKHLKFLFRLDKLNLQHVKRLFGTKFDIQVNTVLMVYYHDYGNPHDTIKLLNLHDYKCGINIPTQVHENSLEDSDIKYMYMHILNIFKSGKQLE